MKDILKKGDIVYYVKLKGKVKNTFVRCNSETKKDEDWVHVTFSDNSEERFNCNAVTPVLSFKPYTVEQTGEGLLLKGFTQERPWIPEKGDIVLVSNDKKKWFLKEYLSFKHNINYWIRHEVKEYHTDGNENLLISYRYCKPYKQD